MYQDSRESQERQEATVVREDAGVSIVRRSLIALPRRLVYGYLVYFVLLLVSFLPYLATDLCYIDESTLLAESKRILAGEHLHRDFFNFHGIGNYLMVVSLWRLLGSTDFQSIKLLTFIVIVAAGVLLTITTRYFTQRFWLSLLPSLIYCAYLGHTFPFSNHHWFGSAASIVFCYFFVRYLESLRLRDMYYCGLAAALSLIFIMHEGIVTVIAGFTLIVLSLWLVPSAERASPLRLTATYLAGFATLTVPEWIYFASIGSFGSFFYNTFVWPLTNYAQPGNLNNRLWADDIQLWGISDAGRLTGILYFFSICAIMIVLLLPVLTMLAGAAILTARASFSSITRGRDSYLMFSALMILSLGMYATAVFSQPTLIKLLWASVPASILAVLLLEWLYTHWRDIAARRAFIVLLIFMLMAVAIVPIYRTQKIFRGDESELSGAHTVRPDDPLVELINRESTEQDYYFGYKWASPYYYSVKARPATRYILFVEDYLSREQLQDLFADLERHRPKFMTFYEERDILWLISQHAPFSQFLNNNYRLRTRINNWLVYQRKN
ncbi:MAG: hypothetical protein AB1489_11370 [Acidobacteriota bacterium]